MSRALRLLVTMFALLCGALPVHAAQPAALERGAAIIDPLALRELDGGRFGLGRMLVPERSANPPLASRELFALPSMAPVRAALDAEFDRYIAHHKASLPNETIGVGEGFDFQLFDRSLVYSPDTRFVLSGIVNRMDRAYVDPASCGEIRLIYRLTRTDYLLKVFDYNPQAQRFEEAPLENQIDRDRMLADQGLGREFKAWLLEPKHFGELDRGTLLIPEKFLARGAIAPTPVGFDASGLQPEFGLVQGDGKTADAMFGEADVVAALRKAAEDGTKLQNIRSVAGFERRLNDVTCSGCHQTRGIGGFHFPGVDWMATKPSNSTVVPASPHFFGDQVRRRDILAAFRDGRTPDYSRGFSSRPQLRGGSELAGTEYDDGWGSHCYLPGAKAADNDKSFRSWTCAEGLVCQVAGKSSRMGMCFVKGR